MKKRKSIPLKTTLLIQTITPLFILLFIKYCNFHSFHNIQLFFSTIFTDPYTTIQKAINNTDLFRSILLIASFSFTLISLFTSIRFSKKKNLSNFIDQGEKIIIVEDISDVSAGFFVNYLIPLLMDDIDTFRGACIFFTILTMLILLLQNTQLLYQNPILSMCGYKIFRFKFKYSKEKELIGKEFVGVSLKEIDCAGKVIRREIEDGVFLLYNS